MDKSKLRKYDVLTSLIMLVFGVWIVWEAFKMPMKDSYGGVMNVWYVSPALMPLFVGFMIILLSLIMFFLAARSVGFNNIFSSLLSLLPSARGGVWVSESFLRFLAIVLLLFEFVYMFIPRVDFFIGSLAFLTVFIVMFYPEDSRVFMRLFAFFLFWEGFFAIYFWLGVHENMIAGYRYTADYLVLGYLIVFLVYAAVLVRSKAELVRRFRISLLVSLLTPLVLCPIFKYGLLVPLPFEGVALGAMDSVWYWDF